MKNSCLILVLFLTLGISSKTFSQYQPIPIDTFQIGFDLSVSKAIVNRGANYYYNGAKADIYALLKNRQFNYGRVRIFHTPNGLSGVVNTLPYTIALSKSIKNAGLKLLLDFHYSDTWADPAAQTKPAAWQSLSYSLLCDSVYSYTKKVMDALAANGIYPDMVQTGNEIDHGFLWPDGSAWVGSKPNYKNFSTLLKYAIKGVRDADRGTTIPVMLHAATGGSASSTRIFMDSLLKYNVEFDVLGLSYYLWWHGLPAQLDANLSMLNTRYNQSNMVVETSYSCDANANIPTDVVTKAQLPYPFSEQGQYDYLKYMYNLVRKYPKTKGIYYWGGDYIYAGDIGGSYFSLFNWQGPSLKAISAFYDVLGTGIEQPHVVQNFSIQQTDANHIIVNCITVDSKNKLEIYSPNGKRLHSVALTQPINHIDLSNMNERLLLCKISNDNQILFSTKLIVR